MMEESSYEEFYEEFHKGTRPLGYITTEDDPTYGNPVSFVDRHVTKKCRVLDVGCGVGAISLHMASNGASVVGVDISENAISAAEEDAERFGLSDATFLAGNAADLEFDEEFDVIVCFDVLEHIEDDHRLLMDFNRFLRPDGKLLLRAPSDTAPMHKLRLFLRQHDGFDRQAGHLRRYSVDRIASLLETAGFRLSETEYVEGFLRNFMFTTRLGGNLLKPLLRRIKYPEVFSAIDDLTRLVFGHSGFNTTSRKVAELTDDGIVDKRG
jgi:ubiquinone/menaquinone biosynthesis C-methylase UbiE